MDLRDRTRWTLLFVGLWMIVVPAALGFLAGWSIDQWCGAGCWGGRVAFTITGAVLGWGLAQAVLDEQMRHRRH